MLSKGLPEIIQEKVDELERTSECSKTDIFLAAKKLLLLGSIDEEMTHERISVLLEQVVQIAVSYSQTAYKIASEIENLEAINNLKPYDPSTNTIKIRHYITRTKYHVKNLFGLISWIDYKTRNWWKIK